MNYRGGIWEGGHGQDGVEWGRGKWDNCNSIINKYIKKKKMLLASDFSPELKNIFLYFSK